VLQVIYEVSVSESVQMDVFIEAKGR